MNRKLSSLALLALAVAVIAYVALSRRSSFDAAVEGSVTVDGELSDRGTVTFTPVDGGPAASGRIFADGSYRVGVGRGEQKNPDSVKLASGDYTVSVLVMGEPPADDVVAEGGPAKAGPRLSAAKYADPSTSDLRFTVKPGRNVINLPLEGPAADPPVKEEKAPEDEAAGDKGAADLGVEDSRAGAPPAEEASSGERSEVGDDAK